MQKLHNIPGFSCLNVFPEEPLTSDHPKDKHNIINTIKHDIYESVTINFMACEHRWIFNLHFTPLLEQQACKRPLLAARMHVWTLELTQALLGDPKPLMLPPLAAIHLPSCGFHMMILRRFDPPLQWHVLPVGPGFHGKHVAQPWYQFSCLRIIPRAPDNIKSINGSKETPKIAIRITDLWFVGTPNRSEQAKMVIIDSHGDAIHVVCKQDQLKSWKADLMENCTYVMHNFKVMKNDGQFRIFDHQYKLVFTGVTVVRQSDLEDLPFKKYKFADFTNVIAGLFQPELLVGKFSCNLFN
ncbi:hypothetical protein D0Y65_050661 [Glycine soja]|uniref:Uncharacterized protein n=1 Tax=Glycine soja TaxID=3848 RepID=A0A445FD20_GLYSO|nr:hypothetical protein D0Y65_050661 [Glycine soja]